MRYPIAASRPRKGFPLRCLLRLPGSAARCRMRSKHEQGFQMAVERSFRDIPEGKLDEADQQSFLVSLGWSNAPGWDELLRSKRILIISEAGAGKTHECRAQRQRLWDAGEPAFVLELATLATSDVRTMLDHDEGIRLDAWLASQSDVATFFLDSIDELKLSLGSFEQALKRLNKAIAGQLARARIVITTRPVPFDEPLVRRLLPVPSQPETEANGESFAQIAMQGRANRQKAEQDGTSADWRTVALMPLSDEQIAEFARGHDVDDPQALLADLRQRNAQEFARRPQDLLELCADWRDFKRIRTHREQVASNIRIKLKPRDDRPEPAELSVDKAIDGASRLALAMMTTRRLTIRHSAEADAGGEKAALDPSIILSDWNPDERKALLERALFGFASYGRVRFHHRSVAEYLAAERILALRASGMTARGLKRLIFAETKGKTIVRPSMRPMAGWLALADDMIFEMLRDHEPAVLLTDGDPESLTLVQRSQALRAYVERYGQGGWRGLSVPHIQIHRFASVELGDEINRLWANGIENPEIREILLNLVETGRIVACADIAYAAVLDTTVSRVERITALDALIAINDSRIGEVTDYIAQDPIGWPDDLAGGAVLRLFPKHLSVERLCHILARVKEKKRSVGDLSWQLPRLIANAEMDQATLEALRDGLSALASAGLRWQTEWPHITADRPHLANALAATCVRGLHGGVTEDWLRASVLAMRLPHREHGNDEVFAQLKSTLAALPADQSAELFWADDALLQSLHPTTNPWKRYAKIVFHDGPTQIDAERDGAWIKTALADVTRPPADRAMLLEGAMRLAPSRDAWRDHLLGLKTLVADQPELLATIDERLKPSEDEKAHKRWEIEDAKRNKQRERRQAKDHASWVIFWREVAEQPDKAFSAERGENTTWNLWRAMSQAGDDSRESGWNRRFIEANFGKETADRLRLTLMEQWRNDLPTLASERADGEKNTYLVRWQLGLAAIYAEAEDPTWATKLSGDEAKLAARYAPIELNGLPLWMEALAATHPLAVDATLGEELTLELTSTAGAQWHSMLLQSIGQASDAVVAAFLPRLRAWLDDRGDLVGHNEDKDGAANRLGRVIDILMKHSNTETRAHLRDLADQRLRENIPASFAHVWLPTLMRLDASAGVDALESRVEGVQPSQRSEAVAWFSSLFGDRHDGINLSNSQFTPAILLRLLRLSYHHVRLADDVEHEGSYSPDERDHAERGRSAIVSAIFEANGEEGWAAKLEMAADPLCEHFKDRILAVAEEHWAGEVDAVALDDAQAVALDKTGEAPPATNEAMFAVMVDRLDDIDDLLLRDVSPREAWAGITDERVMRREIARALSDGAKGLYKIDQEAATADEKETDIRLRSTISTHEGIIELKLADGRSARDLRDTLKDQLVTKYMAAETSRSGCLLITLAKNRQWDHPDGGSRIGLEDLVSLLRDEATRIVTSLGGTLRLHVHALDLRPRLPTEAKRPKKSPGK